MKTNTTARQNKRGFTLVEMIGVLAIIAVLAALLIPRIFQAINEARVNSAALSYNSIKSAAMSYFGKYGRFGDATGATIASTNLPSANWDNVLLQAGFIEKPFEVRIGDGNADIEIIAAVAPSQAVTAAASSTGIAAYDLDGSGATTNDANAGTLVVHAVIPGVALDDAIELNRKIDGEDLAGSASGVDLEGRVKYDFGTATVGTVYVYIAHK